MVIYVDLWSDTGTSPEVLVLAAVRKTLAELQTPASNVLQKLARVHRTDSDIGVFGADVAAVGFQFGLKLESVGTEDGPTLAEALTEVVDQARTDVVLIVDEVQHAITSDGGNQILLALKSARDAINLRPDTTGHFIFIGTGSHRALVSELTTGHKPGVRRRDVGRLPRPERQLCRVPAIEARRGGGRRGAGDARRGRASPATPRPAAVARRCHAGLRHPRRSARGTAQGAAPAEPFAGSVRPASGSGPAVAGDRCHAALDLRPTSSCSRSTVRRPIGFRAEREPLHGCFP